MPEAASSAGERVGGFILRGVAEGWGSGWVLNPREGRPDASAEPPLPGGGSFSFLAAFAPAPRCGGGPSRCRGVLRGRAPPRPEGDTTDTGVALGSNKASHRTTRSLAPFAARGGGFVFSASGQKGSGTFSSCSSSSVLPGGGRCRESSRELPPPSAREKPPFSSAGVSVAPGEVQREGRCCERGVEPVRVLRGLRAALRDPRGFS